MDNPTKFKGDRHAPTVTRWLSVSCRPLSRDRARASPADERTRPAVRVSDRASGRSWQALGRREVLPSLPRVSRISTGMAHLSEPFPGSRRQERRPSYLLRSTACSTCWQIPRQGPKRPQMSLRQHPRLPGRGRSLAIFGSSTATLSSALPDWPRRWRVAVPRQVRSRCRQRSPKLVASSSTAVSAALAPTVSSRSF